jgi:glycosyltransferase involved in cell wall biosynthesis
MTILFYSPFNNRSRDTESLMITFKNQGHEVISLSQAAGNDIHPYLTSVGIKALSYVVKDKNWFLYYLKHIVFLISVCRRYNVKVIYSHLESANFVATISQFFMKAKVIIYRHHVDEAALQGFDNTLFYKLTYRWARKIIAVSNRAVRYMIDVEGISENKIIKINLGYDFSLYDNPNAFNVTKIREEASGSLLLLTVGRLNKYKRVDLSILVLSKLLERGIDAKLFVLGTGAEAINLQAIARSLQMEDKVKMIGHVTNVIDYLQASDFILHPSILESSCVVVKEAGLVKKPVIVCRGVGDFDDYLIHGVNGFCVKSDSKSFVDEAVEVVIQNHENLSKRISVGEELYASVVSLFHINTTIDQHNKLIQASN